MRLAEPIEISLLLAEAFERLGVEYLVGGSLASSMHGIPRSTQDVDLVASPEDTILHKLRWFQMGGGVSERQWNDILGVLQVQASRLDLAYLRQAATQRNLLLLLEKSLTDAGLPPLHEIL